MSIFKKAIVIYFLFYIIYSCGNKDTKDTLLVVIEEKATTTPTPQLVIEEDMGQFYDLHITDSVVFFTSSRGESAIKAYSTKDFTLIDEFGYRGDGPESVDFPLFIKSISTDGVTQLSDLNVKSFVKIGFISESEAYTIKKEPMDDALWPSLNVNKVSDSIYFANSLPPFNKGLYFKLNTNSSKKEWIPYLPEFKTDEEDKTAIYRNVILANEKKSIVVSVMKYFNRIFVFNFNGDLVKDIQVGANPIEPVIEDLWMEKFSKDSEMFFLNMVGSDTYFYCFWNRDKINYNVREKNHSKIFVFDWNLNHISTIQTEHVISAFDVDPNNKYLLALVFDEEEDTRVYKYDIEIP